MKRPKLVTDAVQEVTAATRERQTYTPLGRAAMFVAVAQKSGQGAECLIARFSLADAQGMSAVTAHPQRRPRMSPSRSARTCWPCQPTA